MNTKRFSNSLSFAPFGLKLSQGIFRMWYISLAEGGRARMDFKAKTKGVFARNPPGAGGVEWGCSWVRQCVRWCWSVGEVLQVVGLGYLV